MLRRTRRNCSYSRSEDTEDAIAGRWKKSHAVVLVADGDGLPSTTFIPRRCASSRELTVAAEEQYDSLAAHAHKAIQTWWGSIPA